MDLIILKGGHTTWVVLTPVLAISYSFQHAQFFIPSTSAVVGESGHLLNTLDGQPVLPKSAGLADIHLMHMATLRLCSYLHRGYCSEWKP